MPVCRCFCLPPSAANEYISKKEHRQADKPAAGAGGIISGCACKMYMLCFLLQRPGTSGGFRSGGVFYSWLFLSGREPVSVAHLTGNTGKEPVRICSFIFPTPLFLLLKYCIREYRHIRPNLTIHRRVPYLRTGNPVVWEWRCSGRFRRRTGFVSGGCRDIP